MLIQHLLTIRLFDTIFDNPDFVRRNVIAAEVEKVIDALASKAFSREQFLKSLDRFYVAIESAARVLGDDFTEKQHFLNTVYERFFQGYSVDVADTHGIVYTPQEIVDFMCASVEEVLKTEFDKTLGSKDVNILDPCTGTGNFIVNLIRRVPKKDLKRVYVEQLFANEVMLLPYYIAALNIEHAYFERTNEYEPFDGLCFVDTLDMAEGPQKKLGFMTEGNTVRVERQRKAPITVIIGNPPYNVGQLNENDNNKNRKYPTVDKRVRDTYAKDSSATLKSQLYDPYVKFFRWATDRLQGRDGIVCFVSNNSFVEQVAFDGMRKQLLQDFTAIYHVHLEGNVRQNPTLAGTTYNVFGIQVGVGVTVAVRLADHPTRELFFTRIEKTLRKELKLSWLASHERLSGIKWQKLRPDARHTWLASASSSKFNTFIAVASKEVKAAELSSDDVVFKTYSPGVNTGRDSVVYGPNKTELAERIARICDIYNGEVDRYKRIGASKSVDDFVDYETIKWSEHLKYCLRRHTYATFDQNNLRECMYRPFNRMNLYYDSVMNDRPGLFQSFFPHRKRANDNLAVAHS